MARGPRRTGDEAAKVNNADNGNRAGMQVAGDVADSAGSKKIDTTGGGMAHVDAGFAGRSVGGFGGDLVGALAGAAGGIIGAVGVLKGPGPLAIVGTVVDVLAVAHDLNHPWEEVNKVVLVLDTAQVIADVAMMAPYPPVIIAGAAVNGVVVLGKFTHEHWDTIGPMPGHVCDYVKNEINKRTIAVTEGVREVQGGLGDTAEGVKDAVGGLKDATGGVQDAVGGVKDMVGGALGLGCWRGGSATNHYDHGNRERPAATGRTT